MALDTSLKFQFLMETKSATKWFVARNESFLKPQLFVVFNYNCQYRRPTKAPNFRSDFT